MYHFRRHFLKTIPCAMTGALAGCQDLLSSRATAECEELDRTTSRTIEFSEEDLPISKEELVKATKKDQIRAITEPVFESDWSNLDKRLGRETNQKLASDDLVLGIERGDKARAYPLSILWTHEVVNDNFDGPIVATYCPICGSTIVGERTVDNKVTTFGVSGYLWKKDLVMYDEKTDSLWSQITATAIRGPQVGEQLTLVPSTLTTWSSWQQNNPDTDVLLPPPVSNAIGEAETSPYYTSVDETQIFRDSNPETLEERTAVKGVVVNDQSRAYPYPVVKQEQVINDYLNEHPILVVIGTGFQILAFDRCVNGRSLSFRNKTKGIAHADGSRWELDTGLALDGPHEGSHLNRIETLPPMFWFAWRNFHPETDVYRSN